MSDSDGKRTSRVYFTRGRAKNEVSRSVTNDDKDPFNYEGWARQIGVPLDTIQEVVKDLSADKDKDLDAKQIRPSDRYKSTSRTSSQTPLEG